MAQSSDFDQIVQGRIEDFFRSTTPWNRRLWSLGIVLSLREVLEVAGAVEENLVWGQSLTVFKQAVAELASVDPGVGGEAEHQALQTSLDRPIVPGSYGYRHLAQLVADIEGRYLDNWRIALSKVPPPYAERVARAIAGHLLDAGFSQVFLEQWYDGVLSRSTTALDGLDATAALLSRPLEDRAVLIPFGRTPADAASLPAEWVDATAASAWLQAHGFSSRGLRLSGAFRFTITCRDVFAAAEQAGELLSALQARLRLSSVRALDALGSAYVAGAGHEISLRRRRSAKFDALSNTGSLYTIDPQSRVDGALDLLSNLDQGPPGTATATAWASVESVLIGPGDTDRGLAAERCADIVLCSWPRAELTMLARAYEQEANLGNPLATQIAETRSNREAARLLEDAIVRGQALTFQNPSDQAAYARMVRMCSQPEVSFAAIRRHLVTALIRLFRQRNVVLHSGRYASIGLRPGLRAAAPLVAQGMNMIAYSWLRAPSDQRPPIDPLELAARARLRVELIKLKRYPLHDLLGESVG